MKTDSATAKDRHVINSSTLVDTKYENIWGVFGQLILGILTNEKWRKLQSQCRSTTDGLCIMWSATLRDLFRLQGVVSSSKVNM